MTISGPISLITALGPGMDSGWHETPAGPSRALPCDASLTLLVAKIDANGSGAALSSALRHGERAHPDQEE